MSRLEAYLRGGRPGGRADREWSERRAGAAGRQEDAAAEAALAEALHAAQALGLAAQGEVRRGPPEQVIVEYARQAAAGLIVIAASEGARGGRISVRPRSGTVPALCSITRRAMCCCCGAADKNG